MEKIYPFDFSEHQKISLRFQLQHFIIDAPNNPTLKNLCIMHKLCQSLANIGKLDTYLLDRLICPV